MVVGVMGASARRYLTKVMMNQFKKLLLLLLSVLQDILLDCKEYLAPGGFIVLETNGKEQSDMLAEYMEEMNVFQEVRLHMDYFGVQRFVSAHKSTSTSF